MEHKKSKVNDYIKFREFAKYVDLIPGFIHNLNTPLMSISGRTELIQFKMPDLKGVDQIITQLDKINDAINAFKYILEKDKSETIATINLTEFVYNLNLFMRLNMKFKHKVNFTFDIDEKISLTISPFILLNVLYEMISHSLNMIDNTGEISFAASSNGNEVEFHLEHTGQQLSQAYLDMIRETNDINSSTEKVAGLLVAKNLLNTIEGTVDVRTDQNKTVILVTIPKIQESDSDNYID
jgi:nitrogen-specific signal transduction histidine kinase